MNFKNILLALLSFSIWMFVAIQIYDLREPIREEVSPPLEVNKIELDSLQEESYDEFKAYLDYIIQVSRNRGEVDYRPEILDSIYNYLERNQTKKIILTGLYNDFKERELAKERCRTLKESLALRGISTRRIKTLTAKYKFDFDQYNKYDRGVLLRYDDMSNKDKSEIEEVILPTTKILNSSFVRNEVVPDDDTEEYIKSLETYLVRHPEKRIKIVGHTDNRGKEADNKWVSRERAKSVKNYFVVRGISSLKISIVAMGSEDPIASNDTREGRKLNKRIEVVIY